MAIPEYKNGHFEEMAAWSQILQIVGNSTYRLTPMTALGPSLYRNGKFLALMTLCVWVVTRLIARKLPRMLACSGSDSGNAVDFHECTYFTVVLSYKL